MVDLRACAQLKATRYRSDSGDWSPPCRWCSNEDAWKAGFFFVGAGLTPLPSRYAMVWFGSVWYCLIMADWLGPGPARRAAVPPKCRLEHLA